MDRRYGYRLRVTQATTLPLSNSSQDSSRGIATARQTHSAVLSTRSYPWPRLDHLQKAATAKRGRRENYLEKLRVCRSISLMTKS